MKPTRKLSRRSFFHTVAGGVVLSGTLLRANDASALQVTDSDSGAGADPAGQGRGGGTGITDRDPTDPGGRGRGTNAPRTGTGVTDSDPSDAAGNGRGGAGARPQTGVTDSDTGAVRDPVGGGRGGGAVNDAAQRCAERNNRIAEIDRILSQHPYWSDGQINGAGQDHAYATSLLYTRATDAGVDWGDMEEGVATEHNIREIRAIAQRHGAQCGGYDNAACWAAALRSRIDEALAARGQRQALEREKAQLQRMNAMHCG